MWIFMILVMFLTNYNRISYRNGPSGRPKSLCRGFCSKIECWDGSISHATGHDDHRNTFGDRYEWLLQEKIFRFFLQIFARGHGASETSAFGSIFALFYLVHCAVRPKPLSLGFCSKIECWDGSISHATGHNDHRDTFRDRYEWLLSD